VEWPEFKSQFPTYIIQYFELSSQDQEKYGFNALKNHNLTIPWHIYQRYSNYNYYSLVVFLDWGRDLYKIKI
jgi:hypothetical protein